MIYVVIPVFNRLNFTIACLNSLGNQTYKNFTSIVVDDGSSDGTEAHLEKYYPHVIILKGSGELWWTGATNLGVKKALELSDSKENDFVLTLNNDLVAPPEYLSNLIATAGRIPKSLIGSLSVNFANHEQIHFAGTLWNSKTAKYRTAISKQFSYSDLKMKSKVIQSDLLPGRGILVPLSLYNEIGLYDEKAFPHYMADEDFSLRAKKAGYNLCITTDAVVYNHVGETGLKNKKRNLRYYKDIFISIKSPSNIYNRWNWARRHATVPAPVYFVIDMLRIFKSLIVNRQP